VYELQKLRCNLCGQIFTAATPPGVGPDKYDAESAAMIALLKYGSGLPFNRLQRLQGGLGIPLPAATQWQIVEHCADVLEPVFEEMIRQAAQGRVFHNDDTKMKILSLLGQCGASTGSDPPEVGDRVLKILKDVYKNDDQAKREGLSAQQRLKFHQRESGPKMEQLQTWLTEQIEQHKVEPNSGLGEAISYMLKYWEQLTLFLHQPGAPLDNNVCEQALKKAILHRKNAYFYKTQNGARVGDLFMSLIHTCELNSVNSFDYLTELQKHANELSAHPADWMPWNYRDTLQRTDAS
jgi:hypothetical protein